MRDTSQWDWFGGSYQITQRCDFTAAAAGDTLDYDQTEPDPPERHWRGHHAHVLKEN
jgi:hypothetical protein